MANIYNNKYRNHQHLNLKGKSSIIDIQPRFVYSLELGKHSVHFQSRNKQLIKDAVYEYLDFIGEWERKQN